MESEKRPEAANDEIPEEPEATAAEGGEGGDAVEETDPQALNAELAAMKDRLLRSMAETENVRRRAEREKEDARRFGMQKFAEDILGVADNLSRALDAMPEGARDDESVRPLVEGVELTQKELAAALDRHGIKRISPKGERFDPNFHQAMFELEDAEAEPGTVVQVLRDGYVINDRLLRAAMVGVAKKPAEG